VQGGEEGEAEGRAAHEDGLLGQLVQQPTRLGAVMPKGLLRLALLPKNEGVGLCGSRPSLASSHITFSM
jgi:hypothetical protein